MFDSELSPERMTEKPVNASHIGDHYAASLKQCQTYGCMRPVVLGLLYCRTCHSIEAAKQPES